MSIIEQHIDKSVEDAKARVEKKLEDEALQDEAIKWAKRNWITVVTSLKVINKELTEDEEADIKQHLFDNALHYLKKEKKITQSGKVILF